MLAACFSHISSCEPHFMHGCAHARHMHRKHVLRASFALPPAVEPVSGCQVLHFRSIEGCKRVGHLLWCVSIPLLVVSLFSLWRPQSGRTFLTLLCPPPVLSASQFFCPVWPERSPFLSLSLPFWTSISLCQAVRYKFSLKAVIHRGVADFLTTLKSK